MDVYTPQERIKLIDAIADRWYVFQRYNQPQSIPVTIARRVVKVRYPNVDFSEFTTNNLQASACTIASSMHTTDIDTLIKLAKLSVPED